MADIHADEPFTREDWDRWVSVLALGWDAFPHEQSRIDPACASVPFGAYAFPLLFGLACSSAIGVRRPRFVEIGTHNGASAAVLSLAAERMGGHVWTIDNDQEHTVAHAKATIGRLGRSPWVTFITAASQEVDPIMGADFLFVDGDHSYAAVCSDMARHGRAVRIGGTIILDDFHMSWMGKVRWVAERWQALSAHVVGPFVILKRRAIDDEVFQDRRSVGGAWTWHITPPKE